MAKRILVAYATKYGSTREVAEAIADTLREHGLSVDALEASAVRELAPYEAVVVGGGIYTGRWHKDARRFLKRHRAELADLPLSVFGMGPQDLEEENVAASRQQLDRALAQMPELRPAAVAIFGGALDPAKLRFPFNRVPAFDARDWDEIRSWAEQVATLIRAREPLHA